MKRIVVVEDNEDLLEEVVFHLSLQPDSEVLGVRDGKGLDACLALRDIDIVILDLGLPGEDGLQIARRLRGRPGLGIIMLTARGSVGQRVIGLETGADAYLVKPVDMRELAAVVDSLFRRLSPSAETPDEGWVFYPGRWQVRSPGGVVQTLTAAENRVLQILAEAAGRTVSRQELASVQGKPALDFDYRRLESTISRLRRKLESVTETQDSSDSSDSPLRAARGLGYAFIDKIRIEY